jgi:hypothetical protein
MAGGRGLTLIVACSYFLFTLVRCCYTRREALSRASGFWCIPLFSIDSLGKRRIQAALFAIHHIHIALLFYT